MAIEINLKGKVCVISGGGRGLGRCMAETIGKAGADIFIGNRKEDQGMETVKALEAQGVRAGFAPLDVTKEDTVIAFIEKAVEFGNGKIDFIINNAGVIETTPLLDLTGEASKRVYDVNVIGLGNMMRAGLKQFVKQKEGRFITLSSIAGLSNMKILEDYAASKAAVVSLTKNAALQMAPYHINVNSIAPGIIRTEMWEEILDGLTENKVRDDKRTTAFDGFVEASIPFNKAQTEQDIANAALFLVSDLSKEITGQVICIDGGSVL